MRHVELLRDIGLRAHASALTLSVTERVDVLASVSKEWDGRTCVTWWLNGKKDTFNGEVREFQWVELGEYLQDYAHQVVAKGTGRWFSAGVSTNGRCRDEDIAEVTQLALDADDVGDWHETRQLLDQAGVAYIVQRSSSHSPGKPKWHVHIPLSLVFCGNKPMWRRIYRHCVGWFSAAGGLVHDLSAKSPVLGFDKSTDRLGQPMFPAARRTEDAAVPETVCRTGRALDLARFLNATGFDWGEPTKVSVQKQKKESSGASHGGEYVVTSVPDFFLAHAFAAAGMLGPQAGDDKWCVACPFQDEHTMGHTYDSSTVIFAPARRGREGGFRCSHGHCVDRTVTDALRALPAAAVAAAMTIRHNTWCRQALGGR
jgi:hypothetical protein